MTCIVGLVHNRKVTLGADSAGIAEDLSLTARKDPKIFQRDDMIIGFAGSFRLGDLLHYVLDIPEYEGGDVRGYIVREFVPALRKCMKKNKLKRDDMGPILIGFHGCLFGIEEDFQVGESRDNYMSIGCGAPYALGALEVLKRSKKFRDATKTLKTALECATRHCGGVCGPYLTIGQK